MKYRLEYNFVGAETCGHGKKEFEAKTDEEAISRIEDICQEAAGEVNKGIANPFFHFEAKPSRLVKIHQPEISTEIPIPSLVA